MLDQLVRRRRNRRNRLNPDIRLSSVIGAEEVVTDSQDDQVQLLSSFRPELNITTNTAANDHTRDDSDQHNITTKTAANDHTRDDSDQHNIPPRLHVDDPLHLDIHNINPSYRFNSDTNHMSPSARVDLSKFPLNPPESDTPCEQFESDGSPTRNNDGFQQDKGSDIDQGSSLSMDPVYHEETPQDAPLIPDFPNISDWFQFNDSAFQFFQPLPTGSHEEVDDDFDDDGGHEHDILHHETSLNIKQLSTKIRRTVMKKLKATSMTAIITLYGKTRYTLESYDHLVAIMKKYERLPSSTTMRLRLLPYLLKHLFVTSAVVKCPYKSGLTGTVRLDKTDGNKSTILSHGRRNEAVLVLPSAWARMDIRCLHMLSEIACLEYCRCVSSTMSTNDVRIETTSRVIQKIEVSHRSFSLWVNRNEVTFQAPLGSCVSLHTFSDQNFPIPRHQLSNVVMKQKIYRGEPTNYFNCFLLATFCVQHSQSKGLHICPGMTPSNYEEDMNPFFKQCVEHLSNLCQQSTQNNEGVEDTGRTSQCDDIEEQPKSLRVGDLISLMSFCCTSYGTTLIAHVSRFWPSRL